MRRSQTIAGPALRGPIACCVLAIAALSLGPSGEVAIRATVRDAAWPGFFLQQTCSDLIATLDLSRWPWTAQKALATVSTESEREKLAAVQQEVRALRAELASEQREAAALERSFGPVQVVNTSPTTGVRRVAARLLRVGAPGTTAGGMLIGIGRSAGTTSGQFAVEPVSVAAGSEAGVSDGEFVLAGAAVVGRTDEVGLWTSTVISITNPKFRSHVSIIRETGAGPVAGAEGILEGDGRGRCVVRYLSSTASVSVGDHVYSVDPTGRLPQPLYYGTVDRAVLRRGAPHWDVTVRPAADPSSFNSLHILVPVDSDVPAVALTEQSTH